MSGEVGDWEGYVGVGKGVGKVVEGLCWCVAFFSSFSPVFFVLVLWWWKADWGCGCGCVEDVLGPKMKR